MSLKDVLVQNDFHFSKKFGQNFISDRNLLDAIVEDAGVTADDTVLEIGAGAGTLTAALAAKAKEVVAYEIDDNLRPVLAQTLGGLPNVQVVWQDFLEADVEALKARFAHAKVVANLPYYVTTPILVRLLDEGIGQSITVMVQKEVADRLAATPGGKDYGAITVKVRLTGRATVTRIVPRTLFYPQPNVDSAVVRIDVIEGQFEDEDPALTAKIARGAFAMRRKTLVNNLMQLGYPREKCEEALKSMGLPATIRGECLDAKDYVELAKLLKGGTPQDESHKAL